VCAGMQLVLRIAPQMAHDRSVVQSRRGSTHVEEALSLRAVAVILTAVAVILSMAVAVAVAAGVGQGLPPLFIPLDEARDAA